MNTLEKMKVIGLKLIGLFLTIGVSIYIIQDYFYKEQPTSVKLSMTGIILLTILSVSILIYIKKYRMKKEIAHEVAKNLGEPSKSVNPILLEFLNYISFSIPFVILGLINQLLVNYNGNVLKPLMLILSSITVGYIIKIFGVILEQEYLKRYKLKQIEDNQNQIVEKLKASMKETSLK